MNASELARIARRAARAPAAEWRDRGRQKLFELHNRVAMRRGGSALPRGGALGSLGIESDERLVAWWTRRATRWFVDEARLGTLAARAHDESSGVPRLLAHARQVCDGRFPLFSLGTVPFGERGEWSREPISGRVAPSRFYADIRYLDYAESGDSKFVWEPSRFAPGLWLGVAHALDGDPAYWKRFVELATSWFDENPYPLGVHYCSALEVGLRAYAWLWALALFREPLIGEPALLRRMLEGVWGACLHVEANLSRHFSPNTHLTGEGFALFACGAAFPEFMEAEGWRALGSEILASEAGRQFHADGTHRELSSAYHLYSCDFYLQAALIADETDFSVAGSVPLAARRMCERLAELVAPDGSLPQWNDCDGGKLLSFGEAALDARPTLWAARAAFADFARGDACGAAGGSPSAPGMATAPSHESKESKEPKPPNATRMSGDAPSGYALLMSPAAPLGLGPQGAAGAAEGAQGLAGAAQAEGARPDASEPFETGPRHASEAFAVSGPPPDAAAIPRALPDSGVVTHRSARGDFLVFRASPFGYRDCPHSHDAALSVILYLAGRPLLVDSGTGTYTGDSALRDLFRSARGKNVLLFDGAGPSTPADCFTWETTTDAQLFSAERDGRGVFRCSGFYETQRCAAPGGRLRVEREVMLGGANSAFRAVEIVDRWSGNAGAAVEVRFTFAPQVEVDASAQSLMLPGVGEIDVTCESGGAASPPQRSVQRVPYSPDYGSIEETSALVFGLGHAASGTCTTRFALRAPSGASAPGTRG